jgi:pimeloyl-ACP methyl ester carboxylesterase
MPYIGVKGGELYYEEHGEGPQPVLFVHGFLGSSETWRDGYMARLPEQYCSYAIDVRGHGRSSKLEAGCNLPQLADDIAQLAAQLPLEPFVYVGYSMGGSIGVQLALDHPELLRAMILCSPGLGSSLSGAARLLVPVMYRCAQKAWFLTRLNQRMYARPRAADAAQRDLEQAMLVSRATWTEYLDPTNKIVDLTPLGTLDIPTLVLIGGKDRMLPVDMQHRLAAAIPRSQTIVFENEGHGLILESPETVFEAMSSFLSQLD